jgi:four helix bundle protein
MAQMTPEELKARTKRFALRVFKLADSLPNKVSARVLANQIARSGPSVAANYRAACKARSRAEFISKLGVAEEEADETQLWLELIAESGLVPALKLGPLHQEACELTAIIAASRKSAQGGRT